MGNVAGMNSVSDPSPRVLKPLAVALVSLAAFSYGFVPVRASNDVWWHLKSGKVIVEAGGRLPSTDVFTFTGEDVPWHNHEWLAQVIFYKLFQWGGGTIANPAGLLTLIAFKSLVIVATFLIVLVLVQQRCRCLPVAALITLLALDVSRRLLYPRPPVLTYLFLAVFLLILDNWRARRWTRASLLALPPLTVLWANLHGGFLAGLLVVSFYLVGEVADHFLGEREAEGGAVERAARFKSRLVWLGGTLAACFLASLCTPYGYHLYELPFRVTGASGLVKTIAEMRSPLAPGTARFFMSFFVMAGLIVVVLGVAVAASRRCPPAVDLPILLFFGYEAFRHQRHVVLFAIATAPILGWATGQLLGRVSKKRRRTIIWLASAATLVIAALWITLRDRFVVWHGRIVSISPSQSYLSRNLRLVGGMTYVEANFPKDVCDFIVANEFRGRMFNPINSAGYLIWRLSPETHKLFTDSRFDIFGDKFVWHEWAVRHGIEDDDWDRIAWEKVGLTEAEGQHVRDLCGSAGWPEILDRWKIDFIVAERSELSWPVRPKLLLSSEWQHVFFWIKPFDPSNGYDIFIRQTEENRQLIERCKRSFEQFQARQGIGVPQLPPRERR